MNTRKMTAETKKMIMLAAVGAICTDTENNLRQKGCENEEVLTALSESAGAATQLLNVMEEGGDPESRKDLWAVLSNTIQILDENEADLKRFGTNTKIFEFYFGKLRQNKDLTSSGKCREHSQTKSPLEETKMRNNMTEEERSREIEAVLSRIAIVSGRLHRNLTLRGCQDKEYLQSLAETSFMAEKMAKNERELRELLS